MKHHLFSLLAGSCAIALSSASFVIAGDVVATSAKLQSPVAKFCSDLGGMVTVGIDGSEGCDFDDESILRDLELLSLSQPIWQ